MSPRLNVRGFTAVVVAGALLILAVSLVFILAGPIDGPLTASSSFFQTAGALTQGIASVISLWVTIVLVAASLLYATSAEAQAQAAREQAAASARQAEASLQQVEELINSRRADFRPVVVPMAAGNRITNTRNSAGEPFMTGNLFRHEQTRDTEERFFLRNVGKGPALNIRVGVRLKADPEGWLIHPADARGGQIAAGGTTSPTVRYSAIEQLDAKYVSNPKIDFSFASHHGFQVVIQYDAVDVEERDDAHGREYETVADFVDEHWENVRSERIATGIRSRAEEQKRT